MNATLELAAEKTARAPAPGPDFSRSGAVWPTVRDEQIQGTVLAPN
jgi:hypothetical protein